MSRLRMVRVSPLLPVAALLLSGFTASVAAQEPPARPGERLRVAYQAAFCPPATCKGPELTTVGVLVSWDPDTLVLSAGGGRHAIPRAVLTRVDVSRSHERGGEKGALKGAAVGAGAGAAVTTFLGLVRLVTGDPECTSSPGTVVSLQWCPTTTASDIIEAVPRAAVLWGAIGALIGAIRYHDAWETTLRLEPGQGLVPTPDGRSGSGAVREGARSGHVSAILRHTSHGTVVGAQIAF